MNLWSCSVYLYLLNVHLVEPPEKPDICLEHPWKADTIFPWQMHSKLSAIEPNDQVLCVLAHLRGRFVQFDSTKSDISSICLRLFCQKLPARPIRDSGMSARAYELITSSWIKVRWFSTTLLQPFTLVVSSYPHSFPCSWLRSTKRESEISIKQFSDPKLSRRRR